jgi:hypothetical protein
VEWSGGRHPLLISRLVSRSTTQALQSGGSLRSLVPPEFEDLTQVRHTQFTMIANATQPAGRATSISPVASPFRHSTRPDQLILADAPRTQAISDQDLYRRSEPDVESSTLGVGRLQQRAARPAVPRRSTDAPAKKRCTAYGSFRNLDM